jgi:hypothetical protein
VVCLFRWKLLILGLYSPNVPAAHRPSPTGT